MTQPKRNRGERSVQLREPNTFPNCPREGKVLKKKLRGLGATQTSTITTQVAKESYVDKD